MLKTPYLRAITVALAVAISSLALSGTASAVPAVPKADLVVAVEAPSGELCSFPVVIRLRDGTRPHDSGKGVAFLTGPLVAVVSNGTVGNEIKSVTLNISGPTLIDRSTGRLILVGPALILQPASRNVGPPFILLNFGRVTFTDQNTIATRTGTFRDICAELL